MSGPGYGGREGGGEGGGNSFIYCSRSLIESQVELPYLAVGMETRRDGAQTANAEQEGENNQNTAAIHRSK